MAPITTHPCHHLFYFLFLLFYGHLIDEVRSNLSAAEIGIFLKAENIKHFFYLCLLAICNYFFEKYLFNSFVFINEKI